jgi:low affinity Fe/Cu permease
VAGTAREHGSGGAGVDDDDDHHWRLGLIRGNGVTTPLSAARAERTWTSRALHRVGEWTAHAWAGLGVALAVVVWMGVGFVAGFPGWWQATLYSVSSGVTLIMVFALQHTQTRQQSATQRKLDELLRALPLAHEELIAVEEAPDEELAALADKNLEERNRAVATGAGDHEVRPRS